RDFFVYIITACVLLVGLGCALYPEGYKIEHYNDSKFIEEYKIFITLAGLPLVYLVGHFVGVVDYHILFRGVYMKFGRNSPFITGLIYTHRITYRVDNYFFPQTKEEIEGKIERKKVFPTNEDFWKSCAKLQVKDLYKNTQYRYSLSEMFCALYLVFVILAVVTIFYCQYYMTIIYVIFAVFSKLRASQYANDFVKSVHRLSCEIDGK
ncbi:MAG: hypothetical protein Q4C75_05505, partial [Bergeyella zoohelcum]|nr:hypothetical protein [Bergeyella zoohelcum]